MSKLFKLKEWLTVEGAAKHLTDMLGEPVLETDIYRLALDGYLKLSVNFVNHAQVCKGEIVGEDGVICKNRKNPPKGNLLHISTIPEGEEYQILQSLPIGDDRYINLGSDVVNVGGAWDLMMIGGERLDVEHYYQMQTGGTEITLTNLGGTFVERDNIVCKIMESMDSNEYQKGSKAALKAIEAGFIRKKTPQDEIEKILAQYKLDRKEYLDKKASRPREDDYYPAGGLPADSVLVVRTNAIMEFLQSVNDEPPKTEKPLSTKERQTLLVLIAALCKQAKFDWNAKGVSVAIATATEEIGTPVTDDTIRKILKQIDEAVASRSK